MIEQRETVLTSISDAFSAIDREWRYTYVNEQVAKLAGRTKEEMVGRNIWEIFPDARRIGSGLWSQTWAAPSSPASAVPFLQIDLPAVSPSSRLHRAKKS